MKRLGGCLAAAALLVACGSDNATTAASSGTVAVSATSAPTATNVLGQAVSGLVYQVDANTASAEEIAAALSRVNIADGAKWAAVVVANRPYTKGDTAFATLRAKLAAAGAPAADINRMASVLSAN